jgi:putative sigma-54 modulation protein
MQIKIKATQLELTDSIKNYIQEKMDMLDKYLGSIKVTNCDFEIEKTKSNQNKGKIFRAEVNLSIPGEMIRIEKTANDLYKSIDKVKDHLPRSIKRYKEKRRDKKRQTNK